MHINGGDYLVVQNENRHFEVDTDLDGSAQANTVLNVLRSVNERVFVQKVVFSHVTHVAGKTFTLKDTAGSPVSILAFSDLAAAAGVPDVRIADFGLRGTPITLGKDLQFDANSGGAGFTGRLHIEGYQKLGSVISADKTPNSAS